MKSKIIIIAAIVMLIAIMGYMAWDLFLSAPPEAKNPWEYKVGDLKRVDSSILNYIEMKPFKPEMEEVHGVDVDSSGTIYVVGKNRVGIFGRDGNLKNSFPISGIGTCITMRNQLIYVGILDHIELFNMSGDRIKRWKRTAPGSVITSIAVNGNDVFLADAGNKMVYRYTAAGKLLNRIGQKDTVQNIPGFVIPSPYFDLAIGKDRTLWVVNPGRHSFEHYTMEGHLLNSWGSASNSTAGFCGCCNPTNFALLNDGSFVTSEKGIERIKIYSNEGVYRELVATPEMFAEGVKGLDLAVDPQGRILVLDPAKNQVRVFVRK
ncbi:MAG: hypothetical protein PHP04_10170 [Bacteroidales bacterium]|nr:hypothetical protein [Bacteroidales bacterium]HNW72354.1 hypothetical protein [Bacteroidales bacterium]HPS49613.1 hypothetical protein [Bacteroidales bacterium]